MLWLAARYPNNSGIQAVVRCRTRTTAQRAAADGYYGRPALVRPATAEEVEWHLCFGGNIIEARRYEAAAAS